ncbi:NADP-dependent alcohol dehydrogenase 6 [Penicillium crustosum]|uniref:NADP-dependent alcohol dehydrogenase 6 n=1 Tax=Penicillium crustosum TaxID=36656 RepID=UPI00238DBB08|nr:NADP-dependent alcohol dehydrogenase 6 [Penicillium crustosum]KAJ5393674.1 NADP-dependent alcohol dehydrogenase 6 [Penicillium crustosum]
MGDLETFDGYMISSHFKPKSLGERDVEIALEACGVCGSDIHTLTGSWEQAKLPVCVVGKVVRISPQPTQINTSEDGHKEAVEKVYNGKARYGVTSVGCYNLPLDW